jgi:hypothetical protein
MDEKILAALTKHLGSRQEAEANYDVMVAEQEAQDAQFEKDRYKNERVGAYPQIGDQLDDLFKKGAFSDEMAAKLQVVKDSYPKP